ncbi:MAG: C-terminal binding protein [Candidatus Latescibacterota bacterium]
MAGAHRVVITDFVEDAEVERRVLGDLAEVTALGARGEGELAGRVEEADALMVYHHLSVGRQTLDRLLHCRLIVRCGVGYDNVDHAYARALGIPVCNVPDYGTEDVADTAIGMALALARGVAFLNSRLRAGHGAWSYTQAAPLQRLRGAGLGIVGLGRIGTAVALRGRSLGMDVVFFDPYRPDGADRSLGIRRAESLEELLGQSRVLTLHCPLTAQTRGMIDAEAIERLPGGSYLVNTARGAVVDTAAVPGAIASGRLAGAAIDVLPDEPPRPEDPLLQAWRDPAHPAYHRVLITPHAAFYSEEGLLDMRIKGSEGVRRALLGLPVRNVVNA